MSLKENVIKIWKNKNAIIEGVSNSIFKREDVEEIAQYRMQICKECELLDMQGDGCMLPGTQPCCNEKLGGCGCSLSLKIRALSSDCPLGKWKAELTEKEEILLNQKLAL